MLLKPDMPRPPPPTTVGGLSAAGAGLERMGTADTEGSERKRIIGREEAAQIIQRSWRKHIVRDKIVAKYYQYMNMMNIHVYYIDTSVLLENTPLVKFIRNYIRDSSGIFSISSLVRILMTSFPALSRPFGANSR